MDLDIKGPGGTAQVVGSNLLNEPACNDNLWLRLTLRDLWLSFAWYYTSATYQDPHDGNAIVDCHASNLDLNGAFVGGQRLAVLGTTIDGVTTSHVLRIWQMHKGVIGHNVLRNPGDTRLALKLHSEPDHTDGALQTKFVTISDNVLKGSNYAISIAPQDAASDERLEQIVFERNRTQSDPSVQLDLLICARHVTVRNNVFVGTGSATYYTAVQVGMAGAAPSTQYVDVYDNTMTKLDSAQEFYMVSFDDCSNVNVRNNFGSAPSVNDARILLGTCSGLVSTPNLLADSPGFLNASGGDFHLTANSPAVDAGVSLVEVTHDFDGKARPNGAAPDLGAFER
jgi:hypothetical protein